MGEASAQQYEEAGEIEAQLKLEVVAHDVIDVDKTAGRAAPDRVS